MAIRSILLALSPLTMIPASCSAEPSGDRTAAPAPSVETTAAPAPSVETTPPFTVEEVARFDRPWAMAFIPGTPLALITEKEGKLKLWEDGGATRDVAGVPTVDPEQQGGLGDIVLAPDYATSGMVYLSWAEGGEGETRGAAVGRARLVLGDAPRLEGLRVIWRQDPKVEGAGHYSHRFAFSPDGRYLFIASGDRQKMTPAQDLGTNLGKIVRLLPDGTPAPGNPFAQRGGVASQFWTIGHRNILGLKFDAQGQLWALEHGPKGGDELNLIRPGKNYGWPLVAEGVHYDGRAIPPHSSRTDLAAPAVSWNPVIAPGDFIFYRGSVFPEWRGQAIIAAMKPAGVLRIAIEGQRGREVGRYPLPQRIRSIAQRQDGSIWLLEDRVEKGAARLLRLVPAPR